VYKKGDKLDFKNYHGIFLLNAAYKVFAKFFKAVCYRYSITKQGFQSGKSTTDQLFTLRRILEKSNEFNITTDHLFIDFKAPYDNMIRN
jgi:hypothetical protein